MPVKPSIYHNHFKPLVTVVEHTTATCDSQPVTRWWTGNFVHDCSHCRSFVLSRCHHNILRTNHSYLYLCVLMPIAVLLCQLIMLIKGLGKDSRVFSFHRHKRVVTGSIQVNESTWGTSWTRHNLVSASCPALPLQVVISSHEFTAVTITTRLLADSSLSITLPQSNHSQFIIPSMIVFLLTFGEVISIQWSQDKIFTQPYSLWRVINRHPIHVTVVQFCQQFWVKHGNPIHHQVRRL